MDTKAWSISTRSAVGLAGPAADPAAAEEEEEEDDDAKRIFLSCRGRQQHAMQQSHDE